jgi:hypothetical protein
MKDVTVVIPICAMPSHPSSEVMDQTLESIRSRLPDSEIILMFDGVSPTLMHLKSNYEQYVQAMLWRTNHEMKNVLPLVFEEHQHQSLMLKKAMEYIRTPLILWSEQDTPLHDHIPFPELAEVVTAGYANSIRFHHEASVHPEHEYLMLDKEPIQVLGQPLIRTRQWSGRPHLASTKFYQEIIDKYWTEKPEFIEHRMYGIAVDGAYDEFRLHLYAPSGTQVRSLHLDGRRRGAATYDVTPS